MPVLTFTFGRGFMQASYATTQKPAYLSDGCGKPVGAESQPGCQRAVLGWESVLLILQSVSMETVEELVSVQISDSG